MSARYTVSAVWYCHGCQRRSEVPALTGTNAQSLGAQCRAIARDQGWRVPLGGGATLCPRCSGHEARIESFRPGGSDA